MVPTAVDTMSNKAKAPSNIDQLALPGSRCRFVTISRKYFFSHLRVEFQLPFSLLVLDLQMVLAFEGANFWV